MEAEQPTDQNVAGEAPGMEEVLFEQQERNNENQDNVVVSRNDLLVAIEAFRRVEVNLRGHEEIQERKFNEIWGAHGELDNKLEERFNVVMNTIEDRSRETKASLDAIRDMISASLQRTQETPSPAGSSREEKTEGLTTVLKKSGIPRCSGKVRTKLSMDEEVESEAKKKGPDKGSDDDDSGSDRAARRRQSSRFSNAGRVERERERERE